MPGRIGIALRIVEDVAVAVQVLRVVGFLDVGIGRNEAADFLVVVSPAVVVKPALGIEFLAGEAVGRITGCRRSRFGTLCWQSLIRVCPANQQRPVSPRPVSPNHDPNHDNSHPVHA